MPPTTTVPRICRDAAPDPVATHSGRQPTDECQGRHHDGTKTQAGSVQSGIADALSRLVICLGELDDEDGVLGRETDEHDQADGGKNVVLKMSGHVQGKIRAQNRDRAC